MRGIRPASLAVRVRVVSILPLTLAVSGLTLQCADG
jgi:hypothetical protein